MEVMGLMLGTFVDEYTVQVRLSLLRILPCLVLIMFGYQVIDVFAMPQSGTTVSVESVDHVFQTKMLEMLKQTGRYVDVQRLYACSRSATELTTAQAGDGRRVVPLPSRVRMLAF